MQSSIGVGERLMQERKRAGLSRKALADRTGGKVSERTIARIELEGHKNLQEDTVVALEKALNTPLRLQSMAEELERSVDAAQIAINCRAIVAQAGDLGEADLKLIRSMMEWALDRLRGYESKKGEEVPDEDID